MDSCSIRRRPIRLWRAIRRLSGKRTFTDPNQPITFQDRSHSDKRKIARKFVRQFTRPFPHHPSPDTRRILRKIRKKHKLNHNASPFTPDQVRRALEDSGNSTALSPDKLTVHQLKHMGPIGVRYLCRVFNLSYAHGRIPEIWKHANVIPLLKPGKPKEMGTSYRPISLLCPASKVFERIMLRLITPHIHLADTQHGFRAGHSTITALLPLAHQIAAGFNQNLIPCRIVALAVDLSKAFDTVNHTAFLRLLLNSTMDANTVRWLCCYLRGRTATCFYNGVESDSVVIRQGVPQGSVLSPTLFNAYVAGYPHTADLCTSYADDFTASASHPDVREATATMAKHAEDVEAWANERELQISAQKSTVTLFTPQTQQGRVHPLIPVGGDVLPLEKYPKILGVTFDPHFHFHKHVEEIEEQAKKRLTLLKALTGTSWGQQKETIIATYKSLIESIFSYAAPVWYPNASRTSIQKLQTIQNSAIRVATGCLMMSSIDHLHMEAELMTVREHLDMLSSQYLATSLQREHPSYPVVTADSGPRPMKQTLQRRFNNQVAPYRGRDGAISDAASVRKELHTTAVRNSIMARGINRVLGEPAPAVDVEEEQLPRKTRRTLAQLRSGYCSSLNAYKHRVGQSDTSICPSCRQEDQTVQHIFRCPEHPTDLTPLDLWRNPMRTAYFLRTLPFFDLPE